MINYKLYKLPFKMGKGKLAQIKVINYNKYSRHWFFSLLIDTTFPQVFVIDEAASGNYFLPPLSFLSYAFLLYSSVIGVGAFI